MEGGITAWIAAGYDYWPSEEAMSIDFVLPVFLVTILGITFVLLLMYKRRSKVMKNY